MLEFNCDELKYVIHSIKTLLENVITMLLGKYN